MVFRVIALLFSISCLEEIEKARKEEKIYDMLYWGILMLALIVVAWR